MSLLDNFPHTAQAFVRQRSVDASGGKIDSFLAKWAEAKDVWQQVASHQEVAEFDKRGISVTDKVYFTENVELDTNVVLQITNPLTGTTEQFEVRSRAIPDAGAGLGRGIYKIMCEKTTTGGTQF